MNYFYDESGVAGFEFDGHNFYFLKNLQGDIIEILNSNGESVVQYTYDAWGKVISVTGTMNETMRIGTAVYQKNKTSVHC